jgi:hypothetical protein
MSSFTLWKVKSSDATPALCEQTKKVILERKWSFFEDGHCQTYAIIVTSSDIVKQDIQGIVAPSIVFGKQ